MEMKGMKFYPSGKENAEKSSRERENIIKNFVTKYPKLAKTVAGIGAVAFGGAAFGLGHIVGSAEVSAIGLGATGVGFGTVLYQNSALVRAFSKAVDAEAFANVNFEKKRLYYEATKEYGESRIAKLAEKIKSFRNAVRPDPTFEVTRYNRETGKNETTIVSEDKRNMVQRIFYHMTKTRGK